MIWYSILIGYLLVLCHSVLTAVAAFVPHTSASASAAGVTGKINAPPGSASFENMKDQNGQSLLSYFHQPPSVITWEPIEKDKHFTILSMSLDHHTDSAWYLPAYHSKGSIGYNRTFHQRGHSDRPLACSLRFIGVGLESNLQGYETGGTGYITLAFEQDRKVFWHGFDKNETNKVHCYYLTNKDTGSEFIDSPKSLGLAIYCPILLDDEVGAYNFRRTMEPGYYCRPLADHVVQIELHLRPSNYGILSTNYSNSNGNKANGGGGSASSVGEEIVSEFLSNPAAIRKKKQMTSLREQPRHHAVCTVQTFQHAFSGPMLYMFVAYYQKLGWHVIIYDRFGFHRPFLEDLLKLPGVDYYPFTVYQLAQTSKYNTKYRESQGTEMKTFYKMEVNWGFSSKKLADTADQDMDKTRTYDYARLEYSHLHTMLFVDADELLYCPQAGSSLDKQRSFQRDVHDEFIARGIEEMRYVRIPYSGMAPEGFNATLRATSDFTNHTGECMLKAYAERSLLAMVRCWSTATSYDNFPKSADLASVCPFHYNHWSCDGMKGGGRDHTKNRCRCKVAFDMQNGYEYRPLLKKCHLLHFNDNKYRFQSKRTKHVYDKGDVQQPCPLISILS